MKGCFFLQSLPPELSLVLPTLAEVIGSVVGKEEKEDFAVLD